MFHGHTMTFYKTERDREKKIEIEIEEEKGHLDKKYGQTVISLSQSSPLPPSIVYSHQKTLQF